LGLPIPIIKSHTEQKRREAAKYLWSPFNISAMAEDSDFKIGMQMGFAKAHHKITHRRKSGRGLGQGSSLKLWGSTLIFVQRLKLATSNLACSFSKAHHKITPIKKLA